MGDGRIYRPGKPGLYCYGRVIITGEGMMEPRTMTFASRENMVRELAYHVRAQLADWDSVSHWCDHQDVSIDAQGNPQAGHTYLYKSVEKYLKNHVGYAEWAMIGLTPGRMAELVRLAASNWERVELAELEAYIPKVTDNDDQAH